MYNGIGLQTPRGSGTNGYIQSNKFFVKPKQSSSTFNAPPLPPTSSGTEQGAVKKANKDILEHDRKRRIELRILLLQEALADQGYTDDEIDEKVRVAREALEAESLAIATGGDKQRVPSDKRFSDTQTHQVAARKEKQLETLRAALGIGNEESIKLEPEDQKNLDKDNDLDVEGSGGEKAGDQKGQNVANEKQEHLDRERDGGKSGKEIDRTKKKDTNDVKHRRVDEAKRIDKNTKKQGQIGSASDTDAENTIRKHFHNSREYDSHYETGVRNSNMSTKDSGKQEKVSKYHESDDSDSDSDSGKKNVRKEAMQDAKHQKRHDSDSETDKDAQRKKKQVMKQLSRGKRHDSDDSEFDSGDAKENRKLGTDKYIKDRRRDKDDSDAAHGKRYFDDKKKNEKSKRYDSEDPISGTDDEKKSRREIVNQGKSSRQHKKTDLGLDSENANMSNDAKPEKSSQKMSSGRNHHSSSRKTKDVKVEGLGKKKRSLDTEDGSSTKTNMRKRARHDSDDESSDKDSDKNTTRRVVEKRKNHQRSGQDLSTDDSESSDYSSESDSDASGGYNKKSHPDKIASKEDTDFKKARRQKLDLEKVSRSRMSRKDDEDEYRNRGEKHDDHSRVHRSNILKKTEKSDQYKSRQQGKEIGGYESQFERKRKSEDDNPVDLSDLKPKRTVQREVERLEGSSERREDRERTDHRGYTGSQEDHRRRDADKYRERNSQKHLDGTDYEKRGRTRDDQDYSNTKRRRYEDYGQHIKGDRYDPDYSRDADRHRRR